MSTNDELGHYRNVFRRTEVTSLLAVHLQVFRKRLKNDEIPSIDWNLFAGIYSAASGEVLAEDTLGESLKTLEVQKIFEDGTIGRRIKTSHLREFLTTFGDDPLTEEEAQELIQDMDQVNTCFKDYQFTFFWKINKNRCCFAKNLPV